VVGKEESLLLKSQSQTSLFCLRKLTMDHLEEGTPEVALPVVLTGTREECDAMAKKLGYQWRPSRKEWLGGFWYRSPSKDGVEASSLLLRKVESL
jgi:hypothetical protein